MDKENESIEKEMIRYRESPSFQADRIMICFTELVARRLDDLGYSYEVLAYKLGKPVAWVISLQNCEIDLTFSEMGAIAVALDVEFIFILKQV
jgi:hypothetical protein